MRGYGSDAVCGCRDRMSASGGCKGKILYSGLFTLSEKVWKTFHEENKFMFRKRPFTANGNFLNDAQVVLLHAIGCIPKWALLC